MYEEIQTLVIVMDMFKKIYMSAHEAHMVAIDEISSRIEALERRCLAEQSKSEY